MTGVEIANIVTLAGRADERARAAAQARFGKRLPFGRVEKLARLILAEGVGPQLGQRQLLHALANERLLLLNGRAVRLLGDGFQSL